MLYLATYLGSPASEIAEVIGASYAAIMRMGATKKNGLDATTLERLGDWVQACFWRHAWRIGDESAQTIGAIEEARRHTLSLCVVPSLWLRDYMIAAGIEGAYEEENH